MKVGDRFMQTCATNTDRARIVRSVLALAVVGTLLMATLVPLPGLYGRLKNAASPSVALRDWERDDRERSIALAEALRAASLYSAKNPRAISLHFVPEDKTVPSVNASSEQLDSLWIDEPSRPPALEPVQAVDSNPPIAD
jgi:hypothetical protein